MHIRFQFFMAPAVLAAALVLMAPAALAAAPGLAKALADDAPNAAAPVRGLAPAQIAAIRAIGRNVLAAKKSAVEDPADAEQLGKLRATVDTLIATELDSNIRVPITAQGQASASQGQAHAAAVELRETARADARADARALAGQMRQRGELMASRAQSGGEAETKSAGLPVSSLRAQLFERMAQKLDTALAVNNPDRVAQLYALRDQLQAGPGRLADAPLTHGTPTLQAMPSTSETPIRPVTASEAKSRAVPAAPGKPGIATRPRTSRAQAK